MINSTRTKAVLTALLTAGALMLNGCTTPAPEEPKAAEEAPPPAPSVPLQTSINAVMVGLVDHASHSIWDAVVPEKAPKNDKGWQEIEHHAIQVIAAGSVIAMPGTGQADAGWVKNPEWQRYAKELADAGMAAWDAAKKKDKQALSDAGDKLVATCEGCHKAYKGDLPTEGIVHPH